MPVTLLAAQDPPTDNTPAWGLFDAPTRAIALNSDNPTAGFGVSRISSFMQAAGRQVRHNYTDLPSAANGGVILDFTIKSTARRAGGSVGGQYFLRTHDPVTVTTQNLPIHQPGAPGGSGLATFFDNVALNPDGTVWTSVKVNRIEVGAESGPAHGTGVAVYFVGPNVTWTGAGGVWLANGISLLLPLLLPVLGGMNLLHANTDELARVEQVIERAAVVGKEDTRPTLSIREEREKLLWELFRRPTYGV